ncbi:hypothetical protein AEGHOMDF_4413 [Methylobacterium soli]|nr:hypothetical protein AEGHOMDF_4413 [Methylobacterium soli]
MATLAPTIGPTVGGASVATRPIIGDTIERFDGGKIVKAAAKTVGIMPPPMKPCRARQRIISLIDVDVAHIRLISVKPQAAIENIQRVEITRDRKPESGIMITSAIR